MGISDKSNEAGLGSHEFLDIFSLACHEEIARRLAADPSAVIGRALSNLDRWLARSGFDPEEHMLQREWRALLERGKVEEIVARMTDPTDDGQRLRQSSAMTGILSDSERDRIWEECEARSRTLAR